MSDKSYQCSICGSYDHLEDYHGEPEIDVRLDNSLEDSLSLIINSLLWIEFNERIIDIIELYQSREHFDDFLSLEMIDEIMTRLKDEGYYPIIERGEFRLFC